MTIQSNDLGNAGLRSAYTVSTSGILADNKKRLPGFDWSKKIDDLTRSYTVKSIDPDAYRGQYRDVIYRILPEIPVHKSYIELADTDSIVWAKPESDTEIIYFRNSDSYELYKGLKHFTDEDIKLFKSQDWIVSYDGEVYQECVERIEKNIDESVAAKFSNLYYVMKYGERDDTGKFSPVYDKQEFYQDDIREYIGKMRDRLEKVFIYNDINELDKHSTDKAFVFVGKKLDGMVYEQTDVNAMTLFPVDGFSCQHFGPYHISKNYKLGNEDIPTDESIKVSQMYQYNDNIVFKNNGYIHFLNADVVNVFDIENAESFYIETSLVKKHVSFFEDSFSNPIAHCVVCGNDSELEMFIDYKQCNKYILKKTDNDMFSFSLSKNQYPTNKNDQLVSILKAIDYPFIDETQEQSVRIYKAEEGKEEKIVYGVVMEPDELDAHGEYSTTDDIRKACYDYMENYKGELGLFHKMKSDSLKLLENYITLVPIDKYKIKEGSWIMAVRVNDEEVWDRIKLGQSNPNDPNAITGFSIQGYAVKTNDIKQN